MDFNLNYVLTGLIPAFCLLILLIFIIWIIAKLMKGYDD